MVADGGEFDYIAADCFDAGVVAAFVIVLSESDDKGNYIEMFVAVAGDDVSAVDGGGDVGGDFVVRR